MHFNLHLVSDGSCTTLSHIARSVMNQLPGLMIKKYSWLMINDDISLKKCLDKIDKKPGMVLYMMADHHNREILKSFCHERKIPCIGVLGKVIKAMSNYFGVEVAMPNESNYLDADYYDKVEAIEYTLNHDDGQKYQNLEEADMLLVGVSRTSKSPTCVYLAYNGYKAANIPFVLGHSLPENLFTAQKPLIVGLTIDPEHLLDIRRNRLLSLSHASETDYTNEESVIEECRQARKVFAKYGWPVIDVTKRSIEETSATIIKLYLKRKRKIAKQLMG
jgi:regulator of PEP synthase PpsR (kinase-PPPase family)